MVLVGVVHKNQSGRVAKRKAASRTSRTTVKSATLAPMPSAITTTAMKVNPGARPSERNP